MHRIAISRCLLYQPLSELVGVVRGLPRPLRAVVRFDALGLGFALGRFFSLPEVYTVGRGRAKTRVNQHQTNPVTTDVRLCSIRSYVGMPPEKQSH